MEERRLRYNDARTVLVPVFRFVAGETQFALYVLSPEAIRELPVSPIDGRPMHRASIREVEELLGS